MNWDAVAGDRALLPVWNNGMSHGLMTGTDLSFQMDKKSFCPGKRDELFPLSDSARVGAPLLPLTKL